MDKITAMKTKRESNTLKKLLKKYFLEGSLHLVITYRTSPETLEDAAKNARYFVRYLKENHWKNLKYIIYTHEIKGHFHHHLIVSKVDEGLAKVAWGENGHIFAQALDESGKYKHLANYLVTMKVGRLITNCRG